MNVAVAAYYAELPMEKVSSVATGYDVTDVLSIREAYVRQACGEALTSSEDALVKTSSDWLEAWDRGDQQGRSIAIEYMMKKVAAWRFSRHPAE